MLSGVDLSGHRDVTDPFRDTSCVHPVPPSASLQGPRRSKEHHNVAGSPEEDNILDTHPINYVLYLHLD